MIFLTIIYIILDPFFWCFSYKLVLEIADLAELAVLAELADLAEIAKLAELPGVTRGKQNLEF